MTLKKKRQSACANMCTGARGSSLTRTEAIAPHLAAPRSNVSKLLDSLHIGHYWEILHNFLTIGFKERGGTFWNSLLWRWLCVHLDFWKIVCLVFKCCYPMKSEQTVVVWWQLVESVMQTSLKQLYCLWLQNFQIWLQTFYIQKLTLDKCLT